VHVRILLGLDCATLLVPDDHLPFNPPSTAHDQVTDPLILLVAANLFTIFLALAEGWSFPTIVLVYWFQL